MTFWLGFFCLLSSCFYIFLLHIEEKKFSLVVSAQLPLCFTSYFSSVLYLIGDISKRAEGQTFKIAALNGCICLNWTSIQTAVKVFCFTTLQQTEHGHATQCIAAFQIPKANPGEQEQPSEARNGFLCQSVWATWYCPSQSNSGQYCTDTVALSLPGGELELHLDLRMTWKRHFSFSACLYIVKECDFCNNVHFPISHSVLEGCTAAVVFKHTWSAV